MTKIAIIANNREKRRTYLRNCEKQLKLRVFSKLMMKNPDIVIAIGGDETLMSAFHKYFDQIDHIGFVGIHTGHLGFYTWHELIIEEIIETLSQDKIPMIADPLVQATVTLENGEETVLTGLNDITFSK